MVSMVSWAVFSNSLKDFSFLDIFKMSKNKNPLVYSKLPKNENRVLKFITSLLPFMMTVITKFEKSAYWLARLFRDFLKTLFKTLL